MIKGMQIEVRMHGYNNQRLFTDALRSEQCKDRLESVHATLNDGLLTHYDEKSAGKVSKCAYDSQ